MNPALPPVGRLAPPTWTGGCDSTPYALVQFGWWFCAPLVSQVPVPVYLQNFSHPFFRTYTCPAPTPFWCPVPDTSAPTSVGGGLICHAWPAMYSYQPSLYPPHVGGGGLRACVQALVGYYTPAQVTHLHTLLPGPPFMLLLFYSTT